MGDTHDQTTERISDADEGLGTGHCSVHQFPERWIAVVYFGWLPIQGLAAKVRNQPDVGQYEIVSAGDAHLDFFRAQVVEWEEGGWVCDHAVDGWEYNCFVLGCNKMAGY